MSGGDADRGARSCTEPERNDLVVALGPAFAQGYSCALLLRAGRLVLSICSAMVLPCLLCRPVRQCARSSRQCARSSRQRSAACSGLNVGFRAVPQIGPRSQSGLVVSESPSWLRMMPQWETPIMQNRTQQVKSLQATTVLRVSEANKQLAHQARSDCCCHACIVGLRVTSHHHISAASAVRSSALYALRGTTSCASFRAAAPAVRVGTVRTAAPATNTHARIRHVARASLHGGRRSLAHADVSLSRPWQRVRTPGTIWP